MIYWMMDAQPYALLTHQGIKRLRALLKSHEAALLSKSKPPPTSLASEEQYDEHFRNTEDHEDNVDSEGNLFMPFMSLLLSTGTMHVCVLQSN